MHGDVSSRDKRCTEYCILINTVKNRQCNLEDLLYKRKSASYLNYVKLNFVNKLNVSLSVYKSSFFESVQLITTKVGAERKKNATANI
jgi:hypothetical protein